MARRRVMTSCAVAPEPAPCTSTCSVARWGKPAALTIMSPRLDSPLPVADSSRSLWPILPPPTTARTTNRTQPMMAALRWWALHRPTRAARFRDSMAGLLSGFLRCKKSVFVHCKNPQVGPTEPSCDISRTQHRWPRPTHPGARARDRGRLRRPPRPAGAVDAQAGPGAGRERDVGLLLLPHQGAAARRDGRRRLRRDRAPVARARLEDRDAPPRDLDPRGTHPPPLGDRPHGGPHRPRAREPPPARRRAR